MTLNYVLVNASAYRGQKRALDFLEVELQEVNHPMWVLGLEPLVPSGTCSEPSVKMRKRKV